jgi:hypothetical protein
MRFFTKKEDDFIRKNYLTIPAKRIAVILKRSEGTARQRMKLLGLVVPPETVEIFKLESRFKKGQIPSNKGVTMPTELKERIQHTFFQKGHLPHNAKQKDFEISIRADKRGIEYKFIRVQLGVWVPLARYTWEQVNGKIPKGMKIVHKDFNTLNCDIDNLELLTAGELMKRNSFHNYPKELAQLTQLRGALNRKINRKLKILNNEK